MSVRKVPGARAIDPDLPIGLELQRVLRDELRLVTDACASHSSWQLRQRGVAVRRARKSLKRAKAVLELVRGGVAPGEQADLLAGVKQLARRLGPLRDRDVVKELLDGLEQEVAGRRRREAIRLAKVMLVADRPEVLVRDHRAEEEIMTTAGRDAAGMLDRVEGVDFTVVDRALVLDRFEGLHRRARKRFHGDFESRDAEWLHATRKRVILLQHGTRPLISIKSGVLGPWVADLKRVADLLGDDHDFAVLETVLAAQDGGGEGLDALGVITEQIGGRRSSLRRKAKRRGRKVLDRSSSAERQRLRDWWVEAGSA